MRRHPVFLVSERAEAEADQGCSVCCMRGLTDQCPWGSFIVRVQNCIRVSGSLSLELWLKNGVQVVRTYGLEALWLTVHA